LMMDILSLRGLSVEQRENLNNKAVHQGGRKNTAREKVESIANVRGRNSGRGSGKPEIINQMKGVHVSIAKTESFAQNLFDDTKKGAMGLAMFKMKGRGGKKINKEGLLCHHKILWAKGKGKKSTEE